MFICDTKKSYNLWLAMSAKLEF